MDIPDIHRPLAVGRVITKLVTQLGQLSAAQIWLPRPLLSSSSAFSVTLGDSFSSIDSRVSRIAILNTTRSYYSQLQPMTLNMARQSFSDGFAYLLLMFLNERKIRALVCGEDLAATRGGKRLQIHRAWPRSSVLAGAGRTPPSLRKGRDAGGSAHVTQSFEPRPAV
jgi:hypothetical protein